jgi:hypothetical protein
MMWRITQKIGIRNGDQHWLYVNIAAKSYVLTQTHGFSCVQRELSCWIIEKLNEIAT